MPMCPSAHIKLRTQVQKNTHTNFTINTAIVLGTWQAKLPKQYLLVFPIFWKIAITIPITESTKYIRAGVQS
jgi:hypothetical protein